MISEIKRGNFGSTTRGWKFDASLAKPKTHCISSAKRYPPDDSIIAFDSSWNITVLMDIDDILAAADRDHDPFAAGLGSRETGEADLQALTRAWINERGAPEILPYVHVIFAS